MFESPLCAAISDEHDPVNTVINSSQHAATHYYNLHTLVEAVWEVETRERTISCSSVGSEGVHVAHRLVNPNYSYPAAGRVL